ncbi:MAG: GTPase [Candidatus Woesearchaeota archaeon]
MDFQKIMEINDSKWYLDVAFKRAKKNTSNIKDKDHKEKLKIKIVGDYLVEHFTKIIKSFPSVDDLSEFHKQLVHNSLDFDEIKISLGSIKWFISRVRTLQRMYFKGPINSFYGRVASTLEQIEPKLLYLEDCRKKLREFPAIKDLFTVSIVGFPNVGKTTLISNITDSKPEINSYAFTTKNLNIGYIKFGSKRIQVIDTPGTLARPDKMNSIEKQAYLAIKYVTDVIVFVFDLTEPYSIEDQFKLLDVVKSYGKDIIYFKSKEDIISKKEFEKFESKHKIKLLSKEKIVEKLKSLI